MASYTAISSDVSPWTAENFLRDAPRKWDLSFALWTTIPVAYCIMSERESVIHIHQFMVAPHVRNAGVGASLLAEAEARGASSLKVNPSNTGAIRFYERHGWVHVTQENGYDVMRNVKSLRI